MQALHLLQNPYCLNVPKKHYLFYLQGWKYVHTQTKCKRVLKHYSYINAEHVISH